MLPVLTACTCKTNSPKRIVTRCAFSGIGPNDAGNLNQDRMASYLFAGILGTSNSPYAFRKTRKYV